MPEQSSRHSLYQWLNSCCRQGSRPIHVTEHLGGGAKLPCKQHQHIPTLWRVPWAQHTLLVITGIPFAVVLGDENALALQEYLGLHIHISQTPVLFAVTQVSSQHCMFLRLPWSFQCRKESVACNFNGLVSFWTKILHVPCLPLMSACQPRLIGYF